jgi:hypothetical protein
MENMIEIAPNQLPLFADMLTAEQEQRVTDAKVSATKKMDRQLSEVIRKVATVDKAGFTSSHYSYNTDCKKVMHWINVNSYKENVKEILVELDQFDGNFYILFDEYDKTKNQIVKLKATTDLRGNKIECYRLNRNSRAMKPETILANIAKAAETAKYQFNLANKFKSTVEYTVDKYKKLYPNAEVTAGKGYNSGRGNYFEFDTITVKFKSGSYVVFRIYSAPDTEYIHEKVDVVFKNLTRNELMDYFNAQ